LFHLLVVVGATGIKVLDTVRMITVIIEQGLDIFDLSLITGLALAH
jgi:hypothetical protein